MPDKACFQRHRRKKRKKRGEGKIWRNSGRVFSDTASSLLQRIPTQAFAILSLLSTSLKASCLSSSLLKHIVSLCLLNLSPLSNIPCVLPRLNVAFLLEHNLWLSNHHSPRSCAVNPPPPWCRVSPTSWLSAHSSQQSCTFPTFPTFLHSNIGKSPNSFNWPPSRLHNLPSETTIPTL